MSFINERDSMFTSEFSIQYQNQLAPQAGRSQNSTCPRFCGIVEIENGIAVQFKLAYQTMEKDQEYVSSATLLLLGKDLDPAVVSQELSLIPSQSWLKGEKKFITHSDGSKLVFNSRYELGGWKLFIDPKYENAPMETQIQFWCDALQDKKDAIARLKTTGIKCILDLFVTTDATASIALPEELQKSLGSLGLEIELSIMAGNRSEEADNP